MNGCGDSDDSEDDDEASVANSASDYGDNDDEAVRISTLNLVNLAGSESFKHTGATGKRLIEGPKINQRYVCNFCSFHYFHLFIALPFLNFPSHSLHFRSIAPLSCHCCFRFTIQIPR